MLSFFPVYSVLFDFIIGKTGRDYGFIESYFAILIWWNVFLHKVDI